MSAENRQSGGVEEVKQSGLSLLQKLVGATSPSPTKEVCPPPLSPSSSLSRLQLSSPAAIILRKPLSPSPSPPLPSRTIPVSTTTTGAAVHSSSPKSILNKKQSPLLEDNLSSEKYIKFSDGLRFERFFSSSSSDGSPRGEDIQGSFIQKEKSWSMDEYQAASENSIWSRLILAIDGQVQLSADDAFAILEAFRETLESEEILKAGRGSMGEYGERRREDIVHSMKCQLRTPLIDEDNDDVLNYLTCHYLPMDTNVTAPSSSKVPDSVDFSKSRKISMKPSDSGRQYCTTPSASALSPFAAGVQGRQILGSASSDSMSAIETEQRDSSSNASMTGGSIVLINAAQNWRVVSDYFVKLFGGDNDALLVAFQKAVGCGTLDEDELIDMVYTAATAGSRQDSTDKRNQVGKFVESMFESQRYFTFDEFCHRLEESNELALLLGAVSEWGFDVFHLSKLTNSPLKVVGVAAAREVRMFDKNDFDMDKYESFLGEVEGAYCKNPYHNSLHATDVVQTCLHFLTKGQIMEASGISALATAGLLIAAAVHDVGHPGSNNHFLIATSAPLAIQYNDHSPLENMHLATAFGIMQKPANDFMERLSPFMKKELRRIVIAMVLATDNDRHFATHEKLESFVNSQRASMGIWETDGGGEMGGFSRDRKSSVCLLNRIDSGVEYDVDVDSPRGGGGGGIAIPNISSSFFSLSTKRGNYSDANLSRRGERTADDVGLRRLSNSSVNSETTDSSSQKSAIRMPSPQMDSPSIGRGYTRSATISQTKQQLLTRSSSHHMLSRNSSGGSSSGSMTILSGSGSGGGNGSGEKAPASSSTPSDPTQLLLLESALHMADISNPVKPWDIYQRWLSRVMEEFYHQGDLERQLELPVTFGFDRTNPIPQSKFQLGFIRVIVSPLYTTYSRLPGVSLDHCLASMGDNIDKWTQQSEHEGKDK